MWHSLGAVVEERAVVHNCRGFAVFKHMQSRRCYEVAFSYPCLVRKNFTIRAGAEVIVGEQAADLHNLYRTDRIGTDITGQKVTLRFSRDHTWSGQAELPETVTFTFSGNVELAFNDLLDAPVPLRDDAVDIGYYDKHCDWGMWLDEDLAVAQGYRGLQVGFSGGLVLRIRADLAEVSFN